MGARKKNANGEGTVYKRSDGLWIAAIVVDGKRVQFSSKNRIEVVRRLETFKSGITKERSINVLKGALSGLSPEDLTMELVGLLSSVLAKSLAGLRWKSHILSFDVSHIDNIGEYAGYFVYLLWGMDREKPLYIGQSKTILWRLAEHARSSIFRPEIRSVTIIRCEAEYDMMLLEIDLIAKMNPIYNKLRMGLPLPTAEIGEKATATLATDNLTATPG